MTEASPEPNESPDASVPESGGSARGLPKNLIQKRQIRQSLRKMFAHLETEAGKRREKYFQPDMSSIQAYEESLGQYREDLAALLGWPLNYKNRRQPLLQTEEVAQSKLATVEKIRFPAVSSVEMAGLFFRCNAAEKCPLVILIPGGMTGPERMVHDGKTYHGAHKRLLERGISVFIPQLLGWAEEGEHRPLKRANLDAALRRYGSSLAAIEVSGIMSAVDVFTAGGLVKPDALGIAGFAYGGFIALYSAALDPRFRSTAVSGYLSAVASNLLTEAAWSSSGYFFSDTEVAGLVCPRSLFLEVGQDDRLLRQSAAEEDAGKILQHYADLGRPKGAVYHIHENGHALFPDGRGVDFLENHLCG